MDTVIKILADYLIAPVGLLALWLLFFKAPKRNRYDKYARVLMAGLTSYLLAKVIGNLWQPETVRPFEKMHVQPLASYLGNAGFPSDHVLFAMYLTLAVWYVTRRKGWVITMAVLTAAIAAGRLLALVHSPLDVAGSVVVAALGALWYVGYAKNTPSKTGEKIKQSV